MEGVLGKQINGTSARLALSIIEKNKSVLMLFDAQKGARLAQVDLEFRPEHIYFKPVGAALVEVETFKVIRQPVLDAVTSGDWCDTNCRRPTALGCRLAGDRRLCMRPDGMLYTWCMPMMSD